MNATKRRRRTFQPDVDALEGRVVLSAAAGAEVAHAHAVEVQEQRQLKHEETLALHKGKHAGRDHGKMTVALPANPAAASVTVGTPVQTTSSGSSGTTATRTPLQIAALAANNLDAPNKALQGMSVGVTTVGSVSAHGKTGVGGTKTPTTSTTTGTATSSVSSTAGSSTTTTLSPTSGSIGTVTITQPTSSTGTTTSTTGTTTATTSTFGPTSTTSSTTGGTGSIPVLNLPTAPGSSVTNTTGGTIPGSGAVPFNTGTP